jgi:hypothetical protein
MTANDGIDNKIWIGDSGASCHNCNCMYNYTTILEEITVGNGTKMLAKEVGSLSDTVQPKNGDKFVVVLQNVKFVPDLWVNQYQQGLEEWVNLGNEDVVMKLMKGNTTSYFDIIVSTKNGFVSGIKLIPMLGNISTTSVEINKAKPKININNLHKLLGHCVATLDLSGQ